MAEYQLVLLEVGGIQEYVFGSNELLQNVGASELVFQAMTRWVLETLDELYPPLSHNVPKSAGGYVIDPTLGQYKITDASVLHDNLDAEIIYTGGGKTLALFREPSGARAFVAKLTRRALEKAPGMELVAASEGIDWQKDDELTVKLEELHKKLASRKTDRAFSTPLLGLGVTAPCAFTGMPAVNEDWYARQNDESTRLVSEVVDAKIQAFRTFQDKRIQTVLPQVRKALEGEHALQDFVYDFDLLGEHGASSYLAVIHTDGNGMGKRFEKLGKRYPNNQEHARALRRLSESVSHASTTALNTAVNALLKIYDTATDKFGGIVPVPVNKRRERQLPFRPIVFGGDDVTFVCEGRLGLTLAREYLAAYAEQTLDDGDKATVRGGVAVVHTHFPFARAYELSAALADSAKRFIKQNEDDALTALDWHFAVSGLVRELGEIRQREYEVEAGKLYLRPYRVTVEEKDVEHAWATFEKTVHGFSTRSDNDKSWSESRNKRRALRDALRAGPVATEQFLKLNEQKLPRIDVLGTIHETGWQGNMCGYYDALEALDFYVCLNGE